MARHSEITIHDHEGGRWALAKEVGIALGYSDHRDFYKLMQRHPKDVEGKTAVITGVGKLPTEEFRIVSYHGVIRAAMLAKTAKAKAFRDWAEGVLFEVMPRGLAAGLVRSFLDADSQPYRYQYGKQKDLACGLAGPASLERSSATSSLKLRGEVFP